MVLIFFFTKGREVGVITDFAERAEAALCEQNKHATMTCKKLYEACLVATHTATISMVRPLERDVLVGVAADVDGIVLLLCAASVDPTEDS